jgi:hypothetical protein
MGTASCGAASGASASETTFGFRVRGARAGFTSGAGAASEESSDFASAVPAAVAPSTTSVSGFAVRVRVVRRRAGAATSIVSSTVKGFSSKWMQHHRECTDLPFGTGDGALRRVKTI